VVISSIDARPQLRHLHDVLQGLYDPRIEQARGPVVRSRRARARLQNLREPSVQRLLLRLARRSNARAEWKPDKAHFILAVDPLRYRAVMVTPDPAMPDPWKKKPYYSAIKRWATRFVRENKKILVVHRGFVTVVLPDRDVPIGVIPPGQEIVIYRNARYASAAKGFRNRRRNANSEANTCAARRLRGGGEPICRSGFRPYHRSLCGLNGSRVMS
jgi:hypothetical protein